MLGEAEPTAPGAVAFFEWLVFARDALRADGGNGRRPHRLDDDFAGGHQVHRLVERLPEGAELPALLGVDHERDRLVDLVLGHVALVGILDDAGRLRNHRRVHDADRRDVEDRRLALECRVENVLPVLYLAADEVGADAKRVGVVDRRHHRQPIGRRLGEGGRVGSLDEADGVRRRALGDNRIRRQLAGDEERRDLVEILELGGVHRLHDARREHLLADPVFDVGDVVAVGLCHGALRGRV